MALPRPLGNIVPRRHTIKVMKAKSEGMRALLLAAALVGGMSACARGRSPTASVQPAPPQASAVGGIAAPVAGKQGAAQAAGEKAAQNATAPAAPPPAPEPMLPPGAAVPSTPRYLNLQTPPTLFLPADFSIGPLAGLSRGPHDAASPPPELVSRLSAFLDGLVSGKSVDSLVLAGRGPLVAAILSGLPGAGKAGSPSSWRLGSIKAEGEEAVGALALFAEPIDPSGPTRLPPRCDGTIHARLAGSEWFIEDLSFDATGLASDRPLPDPPWQPPMPGSAAPQVATP